MPVKSPWPGTGVPPVNGFDQQLQLRRADFDDDGWAVWAFTEPSVVRAVVYYRGLSPAGSGGGYRESASSQRDAIDQAIRRELATHIRPGVDAVVGFGAILEVPQQFLEHDDLVELVDKFEPATGSLQWIVQTDLTAKTVMAVRTWVGGYLETTYRALLARYAAMGFELARQRKKQRKKRRR